ncbi:hypothetical protein HYPSUDRAFT_743325 [Hypholoma sublateritium FD-334 SS-4]|uniref:F-box domain-containing protein n=1 Tax=Hypholoma sublateritium (strain FD-334 SS-4) TaxID=945553 RepID=A0A0D2NRE4_HYPSF|nr:hypothetical protein HYPSUDRAFT_743325 [Hypholoma sublateritium FD-334 SS-4]
MQPTTMDLDTPTERNLLSMMPPEMLGEIFTYSSFHSPDAPLILGAVCSAFRHVVRSTPEAWTRLHLEAASPTLSLATEGCPDARWARKSELFFSMAGVCLVDLHVQIIASVFAPSVPAGAKSPEPITATFFTDRKALGQWDGQLARLLHQHRHRIHGLALHSTTVDEAEHFFTALYPPQSSCGATDHPRLPLESLSFHASSDGVHRSLALNLAHLRHKHKPATRVSLSHCHFPNLSHLKFVNHPLPDIISDGDGLTRAPMNNARNLRTLSVVYPIRFAPISVDRILQVLGSAPLLEKLEIEARVIDTTSPSPATPSTPTSPLSSATSYFSAPGSPTPAPGPQADLIALPFLTHLALRINSLPALLSHLLLPSLDTLRIDDLDGKRSRAAAQTAAVLRQLLVRMELPCAAAPRPAGLRVLDMCGIALAGAPGERSAAEAAAVWAWCVRRMRALEELRAARVDTAALWALITPPLQAAPDDVALPHLRRLAIVDSGPVVQAPAPDAFSLFLGRGAPRSPSPSPQLGPSAAPDAQPTCGSLLKFQLRRPEVHVDYRLVQSE